MPAENPYSEAIFAVIQEYQQHKKAAGKSDVPKVRPKAPKGLSRVDRALTELGFDLDQLRNS